MTLIGKNVKVGGKTGKVVAVAWVGERYYWLQMKDKSIFMVPACILE